MVANAYVNGENLNEEIETAFKIRSKRIKNQLRLRRELEEIYTPEEELNIQLLKIQLETKKAELSIKQEELKLKAIERAYKQDEAKEYGVNTDE